MLLGDPHIIVLVAFNHKMPQSHEDAVGQRLAVQSMWFSTVSSLVKSKIRMTRSSLKCGETMDDWRMLWSDFERSSRE